MSSVLFCYQEFPNELSQLQRYYGVIIIIKKLVTQVGAIHNYNDINSELITQDENANIHNYI